MLDDILDLLYPRRCVFCHGFLGKTESACCPECLERVTRELPGGRIQGEFLDGGLSCFSYEDQVRKSIHRFKFRGRKEYAVFYGRLLCEKLAEDREMSDADIITSVPTNRSNIRKRGYDHAAKLASEVSSGTGIPYVKCFNKKRHTKAMFGLNPSERRANILGAIGLECSVEQIAGKSVLIIDDIFTTGATTGECARVLKTAGAKKVFVLTIAKTK